LSAAHQPLDLCRRMPKDIFSPRNITHCEPQTMKSWWFSWSIVRFFGRKLLSQKA
jgi:hypothetical protein